MDIRGSFTLPVLQQYSKSKLELNSSDAKKFSSVFISCT